MVEGWRKKQFNQIATNEPFSIGDGDHGLITEKDYIEDGIPLIRIVDLKKNGQLDLTSVKRITKEAHNRVKSSWLKPQDVLVSKTGTLGRTCIIPDEVKTANTTSSVAKISLDEEMVNYRYFHQFILSNEFKKQLGLFYTKTAQPGFNNGEFEKFDISFPESLQEQQKIADILIKVDETIEATENIIAKDERIKKGLMQDLFSKGIDDKGNLRSEETYEFKDSELGRIPKDWDVDDILKYSEKIVVGFVGTCDPFYTNEEGIPMLRTTNIKKGVLDLKNLKFVVPEFHKKNKKSQLSENDIIIARHGNNGDACLIPKSITPANCLNIVVLRPNISIINPLFLNYFINSDIVKRQIYNLLGGSVQGVINTKEIQQIIAPKPNPEEQKQIASILSSIDSKIQREKQELNKLKSIKEGLMQDLLTGKVRVNHLLEAVA